MDTPFPGLWNPVTRQFEPYTPLFPPAQGSQGLPAQGQELSPKLNGDGGDIIPGRAFAAADRRG
jgi:hypothetical protein